MTELYSIDVRGASVEEKQQVIDKLSLTLNNIHNICGSDRMEEICNYEWDNAPAPENYLIRDYGITPKHFTQHYTDFLGINKEDTNKRVMWNDDITLTLSAFEIIRLFCASSIQPWCGVNKDIYNFVNDLVNDDLPKELYKLAESLDFIPINCIVTPSNDQQKQELVDKVFNRDILEKIEKEKEIKKKEYEDIQSQIKELEAKASKLKEEM